MRFKIGDLIRIKSDTFIYEMLESSSNAGLIVGSAVLMYVDEDPFGNRQEFWAYDIRMDGKIYKYIPEEVLEEL